MIIIELSLKNKILQEVLCHFVNLTSLYIPVSLI